MDVGGPTAASIRAIAALSPSERSRPIWERRPHQAGVPPAHGEGPVPDLDPVGGHPLDPVGGHRCRLVAQRDNGHVRRVADILRLPKPQRPEIAEDRQVAADARLQVEGPRGRSPAGAWPDSEDVGRRALAAQFGPERRGELEPAVLVLIQHDHPPVGKRGGLSRVGKVHVKRDAVVLGYFGDVPKLDRVVESGHRPLRDEALEEEAVLRAGIGLELKKMPLILNIV